MATPTKNLAADVSARFHAINGDHPMTEADDAYANRTHVTLDQLCANRTETAADVRAHMLAHRLPLPSYLRTDGTEMVPPDYFRLADEAGGVDELPAWFARHWTDSAHAAAEWRAYLDGQYVCLRAITPAAMQRKDELTDAIVDHLAQPADTPGRDGRGKAPGRDGGKEALSWRDRLHTLVDELDGLLAEFTDYDRLRFGGPVSRDRFVTDIRATCPRSPHGEQRRPSTPAWLPATGRCVDQ